MSEIVRFSVSLEDDLLAQFDRYCASSSSPREARRSAN